MNTIGNTIKNGEMARNEHHWKHDKKWRKGS